VERDEFNAGLLDFLDRSPSPYHAVAQMAARLGDRGFVRLAERDSWSLKPVGSYMVVRGGSLVAFHTGSAEYLEAGLRMVGAHTDSPCLKVKPLPDLCSAHSRQLAVEVYGGALLAPWFDRDLSLAGRVTLEDQRGQLFSRLVDFQRPVAQIPSLAIHLDRQANENRTIDRQRDLNLVLASDCEPFASLLLQRLREQHADLPKSRIHAWDISAYDTQPAALIGVRGEYLTSARLDNLLSCYAGMQALLACDRRQPTLLVCNDHEEVGSRSATGADGSFLRDILERLCPGGSLPRVLARSLLVSADNAHALHPNYPQKHDGNHAPRLNGGPVLKVNANQRYATSDQSGALFRRFCDAAKVPMQTFVARNDLACGSTIGPLVAAGLGVATADVGCPQWGMHSVRETAGADDAHLLHRALTVFYNCVAPPAVAAESAP